MKWIKKHIIKKKKHNVKLIAFNRNGKQKAGSYCCCRYFFHSFFHLKCVYFYSIFSSDAITCLSRKSEIDDRHENWLLEFVCAMCLLAKVSFFFCYLLFTSRKFCSSANWIGVFVWVFLLLLYVSVVRFIIAYFPFTCRFLSFRSVFLFICFGWISFSRCRFIFHQF